MFQEVLSQIPAKFQTVSIHFIKSDLGPNSLQRSSSDHMAGKEFDMHRPLTPEVSSMMRPLSGAHCTDVRLTHYQ